MCYLCLQDFQFELPVKNPTLKKKRLLKIKSLLKIATLGLEINMPLCKKAEEEVEKLKEEQYKLSREF